MSVEIKCPVCEKETLLLRKPIYEGLSKVGEALSCSECGHVFESEEELDFKEVETISIFTDEDRSQEPELFKGDEVRFCRSCVNYVLNPFMQWCSLHKKEIEATDTCSQFELAPESDEESSTL